MKRLFYGLFLAAFLMTLPLAGLFAQQNVSAPQKFALVIGNSNYSGISKLANPVNDANDMAAALQSLGFTVDKVLDGDLEQMENAVTNLKRKLMGASRNSYGFFFYAGHGVQASDGQNYLIPLQANNIQNETHLRVRAVPLQFVLDSLKEAGNELNMVVLDACRDNPFGWNRSGTRGLSLVSNAPGSIVMYAAASGQKADDGSGRNGLFTSHLLKNLKNTGLSVYEVFDRTMGDVKNSTGGRQDPELSLRFSGANSIYLGSRPTPNTPAPQPSATGGSVTVESEIAGEIFIDGQATGRRIKAGGSETIHNVSTGNTEVWVKDSGGATIKAPTVMVRQGQTVTAVIERPAPANMVRIQGGTFTMGSPASEPERSSDEGPQRQVTVSGFYMGRTEVTQKEYQEITGTNPSYFKGDNLPVEQVSWYDAVEYCNKRSQKEGLTPAYIINKNQSDPNNTNSSDTVKWTVTWNRNANGYRLPTEAEWEYACRAGTTAPFSTGNNITTSQANYNGDNPYNNNAKGTYREKTTAVGSFAPNGWGLYDMHGNVWEWCWDWYGAYGSGSQTDPVGASSGSNRVMRGGSWSHDGRLVRSAYRDYYTPSLRDYYLGFRLVRP